MALSISVEVFSGTTFTSPYIDCVSDWEAFWRASSTSIVTFTPRALGVIAKQGLSQLDLTKSKSLQLVILPGGEVSGSQVVRIVAAAFSEADFALLTDIDMLPLRPEYFSEVVEIASKTHSDFLIARDVLGPDQYPICYTIIRPRMLLLELEKLGLVKDNLDSSLWAVLSFMKVGELQSSLNKRLESWYSDQRLLRRLIDASEATGSIVTRLSDQVLSFKRLDRLYHNSFLSRLWSYLDKRSYFVDYHVHLHPRRRSRVLKFLRANRGL